MLFIDRDAGSHVLHATLAAAQMPFQVFRDHFAPDTPDTTWLPAVGAKGWVVITRDQAIRRRPNELAAAQAAGLHLFALTSGNLSAADTAALVVAAWPRICKAVRSGPGPAFWSITRGGEVKRLK
jgi:hypothetical protein